jgi:chemotaxis protein MotB
MIVTEKRQAFWNTNLMQHFSHRKSISIYSCIKKKNVMKLSYVITIACSLVLFSSCVSSKKFKKAQDDYAQLQNRYTTIEGSLADCNNQKSVLEKEKTDLTKRVTDLNSEIERIKQNYTQAIMQLENLSVISKQQAESIKQSLQNIGAKDAYIQTLQQQMAYKDSLNMVLVMNLKGAIGNINDEDINIKVDKGVVYIDISDKLLFKSGSYTITDRAKEVLGKVALVLKNQPDIEFMVEGHTDNVPYRGNASLIDNWDLSVKRATTVVRLLQKEYGLDPAKMAAAGRSEYRPLGSNDTNEGKAVNRRTRIVILPELDQFFKLLEPQK